ncbi:hypothetical protein ABZ023_05350 [Streptomyces sp. NPDC006367]|uniref:hypothetical protein n=1 Tax=unclassified Streptomyces TaxID=2593676 RepID=UPI0033B0EAEA
MPTRPGLVAVAFETGERPDVAPGTTWLHRNRGGDESLVVDAPALLTGHRPDMLAGNRPGDARTPRNSRAGRRRLDGTEPPSETPHR